MSFDANILNVICKYIDDPKTFFNFALVSHKTRHVTKLYKNNKMDQFTIKHVEHGSVRNSFKCVERRLPNGKLHGITACFYSKFADDFYMYYNGICLGKWSSIDCKTEGEEITIRHYKCECTKEFDNSYTNNKIGLDDRYKLLSTFTKPYNCVVCGRDHNVEQEIWCNFEREKLS